MFLPFSFFFFFPFPWPLLWQLCCFQKKKEEEEERKGIYRNIIYLILFALSMCGSPVCNSPSEHAKAGVGSNS